jgi:hypothetical protein
VVVSEPDWATQVIDAPDRDRTRKILNFGCDSLRNGWAGRRLPTHFQEVGLVEVGIVPVTLVWNDYAQATEMLRLGSIVEHAQKAGVVAPTEAEEWLRSLEQADQRGRFFSAITGFHVSGRKP